MTLFSVAFEGNLPILAYPRLARKAEEYGFYSFQIYEHLPHRPAWPIAFLAGRETKKILVGPVTVPVFLHRPLTLARNLAALSDLTNGRAILGISRGAYAEYLTNQVDRSIRAVIETVKAVDALLRGDPEEGIQEHSKPRAIKWTHTSSFELYVGTSGPRLAFKASSLRAVKGVVVDNLWNPKYAAKLRKILDEAQLKSTRREKVLLIARPFTMVSSNREEGLNRIESILKSYLPHLVGGSPMLAATGVSSKELLARTSKKARLPEELVESLAVLGDSDEIVEQTARMLRSGVDHVCFGHPLGVDPVKAMRLLGEMVAPQFRD